MSKYKTNVYFFRTTFFCFTFSVLFQSDIFFKRVNSQFFLYEKKLISYYTYELIFFNV